MEKQNLFKWKHNVKLKVVSYSKSHYFWNRGHAYDKKETGLSGGEVCPKSSQINNLKGLKLWKDHHLFLAL